MFIHCTGLLDWLVMAWLWPSRATAPAGPLSTEVRLSMEYSASPSRMTNISSQ